MAALQFLEARIDTKITAGAQGGPSAPGREIIRQSGGRLFQGFNNIMPVHTYDISHGVRSREDFQSVLDSFYIVMFTPYLGLRMKDPRDFKGTLTNTALRQLTDTTWQLQRKHTFGGVAFYRDIVKPCAYPPLLLYDHVGATIASTVDTTTGIATITAAASGSPLSRPTPVTWAGEFDMPVTFTDNQWTANLEIANDATAWMTSNEIKLEEVRL